MVLWKRSHMPLVCGDLALVLVCSILEHFTERRLRPLTLLLSDEEKIRKFEEIKVALDYFR